MPDAHLQNLLMWAIDRDTYPSSGIQQTTPPGIEVVVVVGRVVEVVVVSGIVVVVVVDVVDVDAVVEVVDRVVVVVEVVAGEV